MNIAFILKGIHPKLKEANSLTAINLAKYYVSRGHKAFVFINQKNTPAFRTIRGVPVFNLHIPFLGELISYPLLLRKVEKKYKFKFDVIHGFSSAPIMVLKNYFSKLFKKKIKIIHTIKSRSNYSKRKFSLGSLFYSFLLDKAEIVTAASYEIKKELAANGCKNEKILIVKSPIDLSRFKPRDKNRLKNQYGYKNEKIILYYGYFGENKGVSYFIKASSFILQKNKDIKFIMISRWRDYPKTYDNLITNLGLKNDIEIITKDVKIENYVAMADAIVLPYPSLFSTETNPSCLTEGIASGTAVITTKIPELEKEFKDSILFAEPKNIESIAKKVNLVLKDGKLRNRLKRLGLKKAKEFDTEKIAEQFLLLYSQSKP